MNSDTITIEFAVTFWGSEQDAEHDRSDRSNDGTLAGLVKRDGDWQIVERSD